MSLVAFGLGANLGDRVAALQGAVDILSPHLRNARVSAIYETAPIGGPEQPDYANAVLVGESDASPLDLLSLAQEAESAWHRTREVRWGARTLDVDILSVGDTVSTDPMLTLPHPRAHERAFVLVPWAEVDPEAALPDGRRVAGLADAAMALAGAESVRIRGDITLLVPAP